jgi:hypothetical protein
MTSMGSPPAGEPMGGNVQSNRQRNILIIVALLLVLCCCCVVLPSLYLGWTCGDYFLGGPAGSCILVVQ